MADVACQVCREPYERWGLTDAMLRWEATLFKEGAGCPCCEGESEEPTPMERLADPEKEWPDANRPKWAKPEPKAIWTCLGCEVEAAIDPDDGETIWSGGQSVHYSHGYGFSYGQLSSHEDADDEPIVIADETYCPGCATLCQDCHQTYVFTRSELQSDPYNAGSSFCTDSGKTVCMDCFEQYSMEE